LTKALRSEKELTRVELRDAVQSAGIEAGDSVRFGYILIHAELERIICSGGGQGKQSTYAFFEERVPSARALSHDEALGELTRRYFTSRGPATLQDFVWWSGQATAEARRGLEMIQPQLVKEVIEGKTYWRPSALPVLKPASKHAWLLPAFDEYLIAYKDRSAALDSPPKIKLMERNPVFNSPIVIGGRVVGDWKRAFSQDAVIVTLSPFVPLTRVETRFVTEAARRYGDFHGLPVILA